MTVPTPPGQCPVCATELRVARLQCPACGTEVSGSFSRGRLVNLPEPHASLLELFLRVRGNVKDVERELGLSYPTVRARLEEAFAAARPLLAQGHGQTGVHAEDVGARGNGGRAAASAAGTSGMSGVAATGVSREAGAAERSAILDALEQGEIDPREAARRLDQLRRSLDR